MSLIPSLVRAMVLVDGEALVLHAGEKPYVLSSEGQLELSARPLTADGVSGAIAELLSADDRRTLQDSGTVARELAELPDFPGEVFSVAAGGRGDDVWVEARRHLRSLRKFPAASSRRAETHTAPDSRRDVSSSVVLPLARHTSRADAHPVVDVMPSAPEQLLRLAAARGATALHLSSGARPSIRVDDAIQPLEGAPILFAGEVEMLLASMMPEAALAAMSDSWECEIPELGHVHGSRYRDRNGPGAVLRVIGPRVPANVQAGRSQEVLDVASARDGLVLIAGPRRSGKGALINALVDQINRTRQAYVVTIGHEAGSVPERGNALISQRQATDDEMANAVRTAVAEDPDVLVIDRAVRPDVLTLALDAARSGRLVICGCVARSAADALDAVTAAFPAAERPVIQSGLARVLRAVIFQVLVPKVSGGRVAAREVLLNGPAISAVIAENRMMQLPIVMGSGRTPGMVTLADALAALVRAGTIDLREAVQYAYDQPGLIAALRRHGVDTSSIERVG